MGLPNIGVLGYEPLIQRQHIRMVHAEEKKEWKLASLLRLVVTVFGFHVSAME
jgi:hypothetical protein